VLELLRDLLKTEPGTLALVAIVLLAGSLVYVLKKRNGHRHRDKPGQDQEQGLPLAVLEEISRQVLHKWNGTVAPQYLKLSDELVEVKRDVSRLDGAREEARVYAVEVKMKLANLETGQGDMNKKLDRLLERSQ